jgi:uncharacterized membrane protein YgdD (TMEM256/DUF423 family)
MLKIGLISGSLFALLSIIFGAFGAHALKEHLSAYSSSIYEKAVLYQMFHALGILLVTILGNQIESINFASSIYCFVLGIILFSGSLYILAITDMKWLGVITPIGGIFFIIGWFLVLLKSINF